MLEPEDETRDATKGVYVKLTKAEYEQLGFLTKTLHISNSALIRAAIAGAYPEVKRDGIRAIFRESKGA